MVKNIIIGILMVGIVGISYWGYHEHRDKNIISTQAENNYQQAYHDLTYHIDTIHDHLGTTLGTRSTRLAAPELTEVWRLASLARSEIGQLPVAMLPLNNTNNFLANLGKFTFQTAIKNDKGQLTDRQYQQLNNLYQQSGKVEGNLRQVQTVIMDKHLKWMDVGVALASSKQPNDNQVIDGLKATNKKVKGFQNEWGPAVTRPNLDQLNQLNHLPGPTISKKQAVQAVKNFMRIDSGSLAVQQLGKGAGYLAYTVTINESKSHNMTMASVSKKGGHIISMMKHRRINTTAISLNQAVSIASQFLNQHGFHHLEMVKADQYNHEGVVTFAQTSGKIRFYPSTIRLKVALDNGEVHGFDASDYLIHKNITLQHYKPELTAKQARQGLNKDLDIQETELAVYENELGMNVLCYAFLGTRNQDTYRIFINANTGQQEKVELLTV